MAEGLTIATALVEIRPDASHFQADLKRQVDDIGRDAKIPVDVDTSKAKSDLERFASGTKDIGKTITKNISLPAGVLEGLFLASAHGVEGATNTIIRQSGLAGHALDGLEASFRKVAVGTSTDLGTTAQVLTQVAQRTGLTGSSLEHLTSQVLAFNKITKDAPITVEQLTQALAVFNVPADKMGATLDKLYVVSQKTGVPLASLLSTLQTAGPIARQFGLPIEAAATLLTQLNLAGIDSTVVLAGLRVALAKFAAAGKDPEQALRAVLAQIDALVKKGDEVGARQLAVQLFGPRGVGLADAALQGKISLDALGKSLDANGKGILDVAKNTATLSGGLGMLKNQAALAFAPLGEPIISALNSGLAEIRPIIGDIGDELASWPAPVRGTIAALVGVAAVAGPIIQTVGNVAQGLAALRDLRGGVGGAGDGAAQSTGKFAALAGALGKASLIAGVGTAAFYGIKTAMEQVDKTTIDLGADIAGLSSRQMDQLVTQMLRVGRTFAQTKIFPELFNKALAQSPASAEALVGAMDRAGLKTDAYRKRIDETIVSQARSSVSNDKVREKVDQSAAAFSRQAGSTDAAKGALDSYTGTAEEAAAAQDKLRDSIFGVQDAQLATTSADIANQQAQIRAKKAQDEYTKAVKEHGRNSREAREAELERNAAIVAVAEANNRLAQASVSQKGALDDFNTAAADPAARRQLLDLLVQAQKTGPEAKAALQPYVDQLIFLDKLDPKVTVTADTGQFQQSLDDAIAKALLFVQVTGQAGLVRTPGGATFVAPGGAIGIKGPGSGVFTPPPPSAPNRRGQFFASGGQPQPGSTFMVGEAGVPEIMAYSADRKLTVISGPDTHRTLTQASTARAQPPIHITIASDPRWSMRQLALELAPIVGREIAQASA